MGPHKHTPFLMNLSIMLLDDEESIRDYLSEYIRIHDGVSAGVKSVSEAVRLVEGHQFDVALVDIFLNGDGSGFDAIEELRGIDPSLTFILMTGDSNIETCFERIIKEQVYAVVTKPFDPKLMGLLLLQASRNTRNLRRNQYVESNMIRKIESIRDNLNTIFVNTLSSLSNALEQKDEYTRNHSEMVSDIAGKLALELSGNVEFIHNVIVAGKLHDIGKIGIRDEILFKRGPLEGEEYERIKEHSEMSYKIVKPVDYGGQVSSMVLHHHERWNGNGYPYGLIGKTIPIGARILAVADTFNALTSNRPYRKAQDREFALGVITDGSGVDFDGEVVEVLNRLIRTGRI